MGMRSHNLYNILSLLVHFWFLTSVVVLVEGSLNPGKTHARYFKTPILRDIFYI